RPGARRLDPGLDRVVDPGARPRRRLRGEPGGDRPVGRPARVRPARVTGEVRTAHQSVRTRPFSSARTTKPPGRNADDTSSRAGGLVAHHGRGEESLADRLAEQAGARLTHTPDDGVRGRCHTLAI